MQTLENTIEAKLYNTLQSNYRSNPSLRCLHLGLSKLDQDILDDEDRQDALENLICQIIDDPQIEVFTCHDDDIFVLSRTLTHKRTDEVLTLLSPKLGPVSSYEGLACLFELSVDWGRLQKICEAKLRSLTSLITEPKVEKEIKLLMPDPTTIASLSQRRAVREYAEIMVVEDDVFSQRLITNILRDEYSFTLCDEGQDALINYAAKAPDILFLDIGLPDISGMEILHHIFAIDPDAYVVMFSGNGDKENVMQAVQLGARGFVGKPFTQEKIHQYIEKSPFILSKNKIRA